MHENAQKYSKHIDIPSFKCYNLSITRNKRAFLSFLLQVLGYWHIVGEDARLEDEKGWVRHYGER